MRAANENAGIAVGASGAPDKESVSFGELELRRGDGAAAAKHFEAALSVARSELERRLLAKGIAAATSRLDGRPAS